MEKLLAIVGPTAVGKTRIGIKVAKRYDGEIISVDSMQVYRYLDIGTDKPSLTERQGVPHHLLDVATPDEEFTVVDFVKLASQAISGITARGHLPILVGGTGLYVKALIDNYVFPKLKTDWSLRRRLNREAREKGNEVLLERLRAVDPETAGKLHANNLRRIIRALEVYEKTGKPLSYYVKRTKETPSRYRSLQIGLTMKRELLYERINKRVDNQLERGLLKETEQLIEMGYGEAKTAMQALGYKEMRLYLDGKCSLKEAREILRRNTRHFAKRQFTWFKRDPRIHWIDIADKSDNEVVNEIGEFIAQEL